MVVKAIVPAVVIGPPVRPAPVATEVTVPVEALAGAVLVMTRLPPDPEMLMPVLAVIDLIPVLVTVTTPPTFGETKMPLPARIVLTPPPPLPPALMVPVELSIKIPPPTIRGPYSPRR